MTLLYCGICGKLKTTTFLAHDCQDDIIKAHEYVSEKYRMRLMWSYDFGWSSYTLDGDVIERLSRNDVKDFLQDSDYDFIPCEENQ